MSKKYSYKIFECLENDDDEAIQRLIDEGRVAQFKSHEFKDAFILDLENDLAILKSIKSLWQRIERDPKLLKFLDELSKRRILRQSRLIIVTESKETAEYLSKNIHDKFGDTALCFTGGSGQRTRDRGCHPPVF